MRVPSVFNKKYALPIAAGISGLVNGAFVGYILGQRQVGVLVDAIEKAELDIVPQATLFTEDLEPKAEFVQDEPSEFISFDHPTRVIISEEEADRLYLEDQINEMGVDHPIVQEALRRSIGSSDHAVVRANAEEAAASYAPTDEATAVQSVFDSPHGEWDYDLETASRGERDPYVIHQDEFLADEAGCRQAALMYYAGDNVVVDDDNRPVSNYQELVGNLEGDGPWGHGSQSADMVYIRNPRIESEYEVTRTYESFALAVQGFEADAELDEIRHSDEVRRRQPRWQE